jgi:hypothetical protein
MPIVSVFSAVRDAQAVNLRFPTFASGSFVQAGGGTVEYRSMAGFTLAQFTYNNLIINLNNNTDEVLYNNNTTLTINGNFTIEKGILRIGNNVNTTPRIVNFNGDVTVNANGQIGVGYNTFGNSTSGTPANRSHQITIRGNLINNGGIVKFTNMTNPVICRRTSHFSAKRRRLVGCDL